MRQYFRHQRGRMFESDFMEFFSKVHPVTPFALYLPTMVGLLLWALARGVTTLGQTALMFPLGWVTWQFMEYFIHRHVFHWEGIGPKTRRLHDILHGFHHKYPDDNTRLVMPLGASLPLAVVIWGGLSLLERPALTTPYFVGIVLSYLWYDFTHWSTHYRKPLTAWGRAIRAHHMSHHFADVDSNFGLSHRYIDRLMGTLKKTR